MMSPFWMRSMAIALGFGLALGAGIAGVAATAGQQGRATQAPKAPPAKSQRRRPEPYKQRNREQISQITSGKAEAVIEAVQEYLASHPDDPESLFALTVAYAQRNDVPKAIDAMHRALDAGLPPARFVAGPRKLLEPLTETDAFRELVRRHGTPLIHGPMLGCVTDSSAKIWVRTAEEVPVEVVVSESKEMRRPIRSATVFTDAGEDYTAVAELERLEPDTAYYYDVMIKGKPVLAPKLPRLRTFPAAESPARFQVGFGGGAGYTPWHERMWETIAGHDPLAFLFLGDNVYIDTPTKPETQRYCYYRRQSRPEYRRFVASTAIFAIWDDHDFGTNDCWYGSKINDPPWKTAVWRVFRQNWNNPGYGFGERRPGCWFRFAIADVDFFMLDGRYYRTNPKVERPSMLGRVQKRWLSDELKHSEATFKVLASPVPWVLEAKGKSLDTWRGFQAEREEIFSFLEENRIGGVILLSADRHRSDVWRIDREKGYPLYEFESSRLTNVHRHGIMPGALFGYNEKCSFGLLTFDTTKPDPELTYQIYSIDDELIHTFTVEKSRISPQ
jgi:alkaline phosphatase D